MTTMLLEIWLISTLILEEVSANIYSSLLLRREGEKPHAFAGVVIVKHVERRFERI